MKALATAPPRMLRRSAHPKRDWTAILAKATQKAAICGSAASARLWMACHS